MQFGQSAHFCPMHISFKVDSTRRIYERRKIKWFNNDSKLSIKFHVYDINLRNNKVAELVQRIIIILSIVWKFILIS